MIYLNDVDVVMKLGRCGFLGWLPELLAADDRAVFRYLPSLKSRAKRPKYRMQNPAYQAELEIFCERHEMIEGAAEVDREQELLNGGMDPGEALLFAEAETLGGIVVTGDKRALVTYKDCSSKTQRSRIKVVCWEQLLLRVHQLRGYEILRTRCCEALDSDGLLGIAFGNGLATAEPEALAAIRSYLKGVKKHSGDILFTFAS